PQFSGGARMRTVHVRKTAITLVLIVLAGLTTVYGSAQTVAPSTLSPEEREFALKNLQATHDKFLQSIAGLSEKQWTFKPGPDRWSVAEVAEHITVAESAIFGLIQKQVMASPAAP